MAPRRPGRPRADGGSPTGLGTESDILTAAARLFCTVGYTATSTRAIAEAAGVRQASMYHWFATKAAILQRLLLDSVEPSLDVARSLAESPEEPAVRLWALARLDVELLCTGELNIGALYLLPEVSGEEFTTFREHREELRQAYRALVGPVLGLVPPETSAGPVAPEGPAGASVAVADEEAATVLTFVESVILRRRDEPALAASADAVAARYADRVLRLLGRPDDDVARARRAGEALVVRVRPEPEGAISVDRQN